MADNAQGEDEASVERWHLTLAGETHDLAITFDGVFKRRFVWSIDGTEVAGKQTSEDRFTLVAGDRPAALSIRMAQLSDSARRVRLFTADNTAVVHAAAAAGIGGTDLDPEPGSRAAHRNARMVEHPWRYTATRTVTAIALLAVPVIGAWLLAQILGALPKPDLHLNLPEIPFPDIHLPEIPTPDINLPSLPVPDPPEWLQQAAQFVVPVLIAFAVARTEVRRRRRLLEQRRRARAGSAGHAQTPPAPTRDDGT